MREPRQLAGCVIPDDDGRILLLHRIKGGLFQLEIPGGKVEDETHEAAAKREVAEEIGVEVAIQKQLGGTIFGQYGVYWEYTWFLATITEGEPHIVEPQNHDRLGYFDILQSPPQGMSYSPNVRDLARDLQTGRIQL